jgi:type IV secretion system protein VirB1
MFEACALEPILGDVPAAVMRAVAKVESSFNPYAIGVVGDQLVRQPRTLSEATATAERLQELGKNFSVGIAQVNIKNFKKLGIQDWESAFDRCTNARGGASILADCYRRAGGNLGHGLSCYYSGTFSVGYEHGYVQRVLDVLGKLPGYVSHTASAQDGRATRVPNLQADQSDPVSPSSTATQAGPQHSGAARVRTGHSSLEVVPNSPRPRDRAFVF